MLALGLLSIAVGSSFFMSAKSMDRHEKTFQEYMQDADIYLGNGEYYKAVVSYENALAIEENNKEAMSGLASVYSRQANYEDEADIRNRLAEIDPSDLDNQIRMIEILIHDKEYDTAKQRVEELMLSNDSDTLKALYGEMTVDPPVFNLPSGVYDDYQLLQLTNTYSNALVYYTTDGSEPTRNSDTYIDGIVISYPETIIRAKAIGPLGYESEEVTLNFSITKTVEQISLGNSHTLNYIANNMFNRSWNALIFNYELAQLRDIYILGDYDVKGEPEDESFFDGYYKRYDDKETDLGDHSLEFVKYTPFLRTLSVSYQQDLDLTPLASLRYIENLSLLNDNISDITPLTGLTSLKRLALGWNHINDISAVADLVNLESLGLWNNEISDIAPLQNLTGLTYLDVSHNRVSQIECVSQMKDLNEVWINDNQIQDISPLNNCQKLMVLMQGDNPISDFGDVKEMSGKFYKSDLEW